MSKISIFGLGYVGAVTAACLANEGHYVVGVDPNETKVNMINEGKSPIIEEGISKLINAALSSGKLCAMTDSRKAVMETEISLICVGTPSQSNGNLDLKYVRRVCEEIGIVLREKADRHVIICRITMLPGSMREVVIPILQKHSGKKAGQGFGVCNNPEFLREGTAVYDFYNPPKTVIGETDTRSGDIVAGLYSKLSAPMIRSYVLTAEMV